MVKLKSWPEFLCVVAVVASMVLLYSRQSGAGYLPHSACMLQHCIGVTFVDPPVDANGNKINPPNGCTNSSFNPLHICIDVSSGQMQCPTSGGIGQSCPGQIKNGGIPNPGTTCYQSGMAC